MQFVWRLPRSLRRDGIQESMSWTGVCLVCNCRILDASFHSVNLVPCPAPVTVADLPLGLVCVDDFHAEAFQDSRIGPWRPGHIDRHAPDGAPGLDTWDGDSLRSLDLQSKTLLCVRSLIAWVPLISPCFCCRPGWLTFPRMMCRLIGVLSLT